MFDGSPVGKAAIAVLVFLSSTAGRRPGDSKGAIAPVRVDTRPSIDSNHAVTWMTIRTSETHAYAYARRRLSTGADRHPIMPSTFAHPLFTCPHNEKASILCDVVPINAISKSPGELHH